MIKIFELLYTQRHKLILSIVEGMSRLRCPQLVETLVANVSLVGGTLSL